MSLTNSMVNLTQEITNSTNKRIESIASSKRNTKDMINIYKSKRMNDEKENKNKRVQLVTELKKGVKDLLSTNYKTRKTMSSNMRQSLDSFMNNLRNSTSTLLNTCKKERNLVAADVLGAKVEWAGLLKKKVDNSPSHEYLIDSSSQINNLKSSGEIPNDAGYSPDDFLFNCNNTDSIINPIVEKVNAEQYTNIQEKKVNINLILEKRVFDYIKESKNGSKISEITGLVDSFNEDYSVQDLLSMMIDKGMIKKYKQKYYILEENSTI